MRIKLVAAALVVLLLSGGAWAWWSNRPNPQIVKAEAISQKIFQGNSGPPDITKPEVREQFQQLRTEVESMPEATREEFVAGQRQRMQEHMQQQFDRYFAMTPEEKKKELDRVIDSMSSMRKMFEQERAKRDAERKAGKSDTSTADAGRGPGGGGPGGGGPGGGGPGGPGGGGPGFGPPRGITLDPAKRQERGKKMLDATTPEFRAKASEFAKDMFARMKERGIESPFPGGPPF